MPNTTVRGALRGTTATLALCAALAGGAATASAEGLPLEQATDTTSAPAGTAPIGEEFTSNGSSTISSSVNAKVTCLLQNTFSASGKWNC
ncbi:hypothetical protein NBRGN_016_01860 [Nocardia brasiliensis NBRC 14402]|uniref:hypothetical protein n=1 Tax=Nocardia brasiliensis TaxID=37326 RepID=UPI00031391F2|nr:hypothetical protein [Nocardia brasiliensis]ASF12532.1 hypothetical protein CEQ30_40105 [Nocardia brasiliensis]GAJ79800.1 hypothetical protein NBRGN_016_01860 [Nocardia brasiliensis NBRC 14402]SUB53529.1 Uncharacterised protein [Nocardia brasiliensis]